MHNTADFIGAFGVGSLLLAYLFIVLKIMKPDDKGYIWMNVIGSALACFASYLIDYLPFVVLEGGWFLVAIIALLKNYFKSTA